MWFLMMLLVCLEAESSAELLKTHQIGLHIASKLSGSLADGNYSKITILHYFQQKAGDEIAYYETVLASRSNISIGFQVIRYEN